MVFVFEFFYIMDFVDIFPYIELALNPRDEVYLIMIDDHFDVFLDLVCEDFIDYFCIDIHKGIWSEIPFLCWIFVWFRYQNNFGSIE